MKAPEKKLLLVPTRAPNELPKWKKPDNVKHAAVVISQLGRNMHEHAYLVGRTLLWVKEEVGHGKFLAWLKENVWFGHATASHMMRFAGNCAKAGSISDYHPRKLLTVRNSATKKQPKKKSAVDTDVRPPELRCYFDIEENLRSVFFDLKEDQRTDLLSSIRELLNNLEREAKGEQSL